MLDHIIVGDQGSTSLREENVLPDRTTGPADYTPIAMQWVRKMSGNQKCKGLFMMKGAEGYE